MRVLLPSFPPPFPTPHTCPPPSAGPCRAAKLLVTQAGAERCGAIACQLLDAVPQGHREAAIGRVNNNGSSPLTMAAYFGNSTFLEAWLWRPEVTWQDVMHATPKGECAEGSEGWQ